MKASEEELLRQLPAVPVPPELDAWVFERACEALDTAPRPPEPVHVPRTEALVYAASLTAYLAVLARVVHSVAQHALRALGG